MKATRNQFNEKIEQQTMQKAGELITHRLSFTALAASLSKHHTLVYWGLCARDVWMCIRDWKMYELRH